MKLALYLCCGCTLLACFVDASLGSHQRPSETARPAEGEGPGDAARDEHEPGTDGAAREAAVPPREMALPPAEVTTPDAPRTMDSAKPPAEAMATEPAHDAPADDGTEPVPDGEHAPAEDAAAPQPDQPHDPPASEEPPAPLDGCDVATDNPCFSCEQSHCCEPRRACLDHAGCACRMECRTAEHPEDCAATCAAAADRYEPWLQCLRAQCAEGCAL
jgi:hypothetical protein